MVDTRLKIDERPLKVVDCFELGDFIAKALGLNEFSVPADLESSNDVCHRLNVTGTHFDLETKGYLPGMDEYDEERVREIIESRFAQSYSLQAIMEYLCVERKIEPGEYLIVVSW